VVHRVPGKWRNLTAREERVTVCSC
jgi:hypothetical protein